MLTLSPRPAQDRRPAHDGPARMARHLMQMHWRAEQALARPDADDPPAGPTSARADAPDDARDRLRSSPTWTRRRAATLVAARHRCTHCGGQATHVEARSGAFAPSASPESLIALCDPCREKRQGGPLGDTLAVILARAQQPAARTA